MGLNAVSPRQTKMLLVGVQEMLHGIYVSPIFTTETKTRSISLYPTVFTTNVIPRLISQSQAPKTRFEEETDSLSVKKNSIPLHGQAICAKSAKSMSKYVSSTLSSAVYFAFSSFLSFAFFPRYGPFKIRTLTPVCFGTTVSRSS